MNSAWLRCAEFWRTVEANLLILQAGESTYNEEVSISVRYGNGL